LSKGRVFILACPEGPVDYISKIKSEIASGGLKAELIEHPEIDGAKSEEAAKATGVPVDCVLKALLLVPEKEGAGVPVVAVLLGNSKINFKKLPSHRMAKLDELQKILGAGIGEVPPVFLPLPVLIDKKVLEKAIVVGSAGSRFAGVRMVPSEMLKHNKPVKVADISI
jgi:prolyl-tRNA editing enzyme YbaK/EbsC (Cys-tRNA(Pro) deacylase)